jgi:hypothetical protein
MLSNKVFLRPAYLQALKICIPYYLGNAAICAFIFAILAVSFLPL